MTQAENASESEVTMRNKDWYAKTAYDSRRKKDLLPLDPKAWKGKECSLRAHPLPIGVHCGDYRSDLDKKTIRELRNNCIEERLNHEYTELYTAANPKVVVGTLRWVGGIVSILGLLPTFLALNSGELSVTDWRNYIFFVVPFFIFTLCSILIKITPDKNNTILNRQTGLITIPRLGKKPPIILPFAEFDGYYFCSQTTVGVNYHLYLGHRFTPIGFSTGKEWTDRCWIHGEWEWLQQYMDTSMPLPDLPSLEPYRHLDPTTAAYDKLNNRPPNYWRDIDLDELEKERKEGIKAIENFPWEKIPTDHIPDEIMDKLLPGVRLFS